MAYLKIKKIFLSSILLLLGSTLNMQTVIASDHADTAFLKEISRHDARLTDFYAFIKQKNLVLVLAIDPTIKAGTSDYIFPTDVVYRMFIDSNSKVSYYDEQANITYGGTVKYPKKIKEDIIFEVTFDANNTPTLNIKGLKKKAVEKIKLFSGLRDDPFIVSIRIGKNIAAIVLEMPLDLITDDNYYMEHDIKVRDTLLLWTTSSVSAINGEEQEFIGRAFRSTFPENDAMNTLHPRLHYSELSVAPDVIFLNLKQPIGYPNGRLLTDDVVDLIADPRILAIDIPSPTENDVPFLAKFPYLAPPQ